VGRRTGSGNDMQQPNEQQQQQQQKQKVSKRSLRL
jgi:hypothetical protein